MVMYADEFQTKEKQKLTNIKNELQHMRESDYERFPVFLIPSSENDHTYD